MSSQLPEDPWVAGALPGLYGAVADDAAARTTLDRTMPNVVRRVRRRRVVKATGLGAATAVVVAALAVGAVAAPWRQATPVPGPGLPAVVSPSPTPETAPAPDERTPSPDAKPACSAQEQPIWAPPDLSALPETIQHTALALLAATWDCDDDALIAMSTEPETGWPHGITPEDLWRLPQAERTQPRYRALETLIARTSWSTVGDGSALWPRVADPLQMDDPTAWQEVVDAGFLTDEEAATWREARTYPGWILQIDPDGTWQYWAYGG